MKPLELTNQKFGKLLVLNRESNNKSGNTMWKCLCDCGNIIITSGHCLKNGYSKSCGCTRNEKIKYINYKHGKSSSRLFTIWQGMCFRCTNPKFKDYESYKGKGICICDEWKDNFQAFYDWSINNGYKENLSIDRINVNGNYEPNNCRWVNNYIQANNRTNNHHVTYHDETDTFTNMCRKLNVNVKTIYGRMKNNRRSFEQAVDEFEFTPPFKEYNEK